MTANPGDLPAELAWLATAWKVATPPRRGPKPAHTIEEILAAALRLADEGGIEDVSLPKIADRIGVTTNALYRYVGSKDELLQLLNDTGIGEPPDLRDRGWRAAATDWSHALIDRYRRHPWLLDIPISGVPITPNSLMWVEVLLQRLDERLSDQQKLGCVLLLDGHCRSMTRLIRDLDTSSRPPLEAADSFLRPLMRERGLPVLASMLAGYAYRDGHDEETVEFGLQRILDGIEVLIERP